MLGFFPKEGFLEPLSKILIFHGLCSERSFGSFFKNHNIFVDNKLLENPKILVDREKSFIKIEEKFCGRKAGSSREAALASQDSASASAAQVVSSRKVAFAAQDSASASATKADSSREAAFATQDSASVFATQAHLSRETAFATQDSASASAAQADSSREAASVSKDESKANASTVLPPQSHLYILMHKPTNCVCSRVSDKSKTVYQVLKEALVKMVLFSKEEKLENQKNPNINLGGKITEKQFNALSSLGRLDKDTTGLLLFSTNGSFIHFVTDEKNKIAKTYRVKLKKALTKEEQAFYEKQLESGIMLEAEKKAKPAFVKKQKVQWESENSCLFTIEQGIFHQVRRSFVALGNEVVELHRIKIGDLELPANLQAGTVKILKKSL